MKKLSLLLLGLALLLSGCVTRTYQLTQDRVDQNLSAGNRGYIMGSHPGTEAPRKTERTVRVFEFELGKSYKIQESAPKADAMPVSDYAPAASFEDDWASEQPVLESVTFKKYTVLKNDTLQKISQKFYGTTRKWTKIYDANKDTLKAPDRLYPGQVLNIPEESMKEEIKPLDGSLKKIK